MNKILLASLLMLLTLTASAQERRELHILSTNDMHAAIEQFPRLGFVADSLRALYPDLLILSAGDNRSGDPINDMFEIPAYPMVALMNQVGFHATAVGNHEFDSNQYGLAKLIGLSAFSTLCANMEPDPKFNMHVKPYQLFDCGGISVGVLGITALGSLGTPESHPARMTDIKFMDPLETIKKYEFLRKQCDVVLLLSHLGYKDDVKFSAQLPWVDIIVGGHSHTQLDGGEIHNGILITQNMKSLPFATHSTLVLEGNKIVEKKAERIAVAGKGEVNNIIAALVQYFSENPAFKRVLAVAETPFACKEELGCLMCDAYIVETGADFSYQNAGGVRIESHPAGDLTMGDVMMVDPFQNAAVELNVTGKELSDMLISCYDNDNQRFPYVSGMTCEITLNPADKTIKKLVIFDKDGKKLNLKKTYRVVSNSYSVAVSPTNRHDEGHSLGITTPDLIKSYLEHQGRVSYEGRRCLKFVSK
ncbi:MAG: bifunctional metallophosphatase/5'-nucleotidase [Prevotella sp.]|nr:bifunctional metallophosphatase/5'-nucleotidase [Prevotella sp.]